MVSQHANNGHTTQKGRVYRQAAGSICTKDMSRHTKQAHPQKKRVCMHRAEKIYSESKFTRSDGSSAYTEEKDRHICWKQLTEKKGIGIQTPPTHSGKPV